ncbi:Peroxidase, family 2-domain-containing protein [Mycena leptocephala]|nr:Peroxidase, family 2-domain-containing protein [Mycena leptocephala]
MHTINFTLIVAAFAASGTLAQTQDYFEVPLREHQWHAPRVTDVRSPCPGLNTLANHGYLPRDGKHITAPMMLKAASGTSIKEMMLSGKVRPSGEQRSTTLNLDDLRLHNLIEHDASLSRQDFAVGDNLHFNETIFTTLANSNPGVMHARLADSLANTPNVTNSPKSLGIRGIESAFYLSAMGDPVTGVAPKKFVKIFFREERLPVAEGWKRSKTQTTFETVEKLSSIILQGSNDVPTQPCEPHVLGPGITL